MKYESASKMSVLAGTLVIIIACFAVYIPAIKGDFIWDDDQYVTANPLLTEPNGLYRIWFSTDSPSQYFPLTYTTFRIEYHLWKLSPMGYHIDNVAIHITSALLLWLILRRLSIPGAWFASAVFALHPVQVESVAWITERKNILMLFFSLLSFLCWIEFVFGRRSGYKVILLYACSLLFYALALFSKTTACALPLAMVLILWLKRSPLTVKRCLQIAPFVAMGIAMGLLVIWWEKHHQWGDRLHLGLSPADKLLIAGRALWFYLWKLFWPTKLTFSYPRWHINQTEIWQYIYPAGYMLMLACAWLWRERIGRAVIIVVLFFAGTLLPMLGFFSLYTFIYTFVADHYQYAACIGPITLTAACGVYVFRRQDDNGKVIMLSAAGVLLFTLGTLSWKQSRIYKNPETLWEDTINKNPDSWLAHGALGKIRLEQGRVDEALIHIKRKLELASYTEKMISSPLVNGYFTLARILQVQNKPNEATNYYRKAIAGSFPDSAAAYYNLGVIFIGQGQAEDAISCFRQATELNPNHYEFYYNWGIELSDMAKKKEGQTSEKLFSEACEKLQKTTELKPDFYPAYYIWGITLLEQAKRKEGKVSEKLFNDACEKFKKSTELKPDFDEGYLNWRATLIQWAKENETNEEFFNNACEKFKKAIDAGPDKLEAYQNWGSKLLELAHQKSGRQQENLLKEGISVFMKVEELKPGAAAYNLGCSWCFLGDEDKCQMWLKIGEGKKTLPNKQYAIEDPDLKAVQDKEWFRSIRWNGE